jgi:hypothetical protein
MHNTEKSKKSKHKASTKHNTPQTISQHAHTQRVLQLQQQNTHTTVSITQYRRTHRETVTQPQTTITNNTSTQWLKQKLSITNINHHVTAYTVHNNNLTAKHHMTINNTDTHAQRNISHKRTHDRHTVQYAITQRVLQHSNKRTHYRYTHSTDAHREQ